MNERFLLRTALLIGACVPLLCEPAWAQDEHADHSPHEHFGRVHIPISCTRMRSDNSIELSRYSTPSFILRPSKHSAPLPKPSPRVPWRTGA